MITTIPEGLVWPDAPTCHEGAPRYTNFEIKWDGPFPEGHTQREMNPYGYPFRDCSYCGSIHPLDLAKWLLDADADVRLGGADWKYGWPHKFYVEGIPNPLAGQRVAYGKGPQGLIYGNAAEFTHAKWYNEHLMELDDDAFAFMSQLLFERTGISFVREMVDGIMRLKYLAPGRGYQP